MWKCLLGGVVVLGKDRVEDYARFKVVGVGVKHKS